MTNKYHFSTILITVISLLTFSCKEKVKDCPRTFNINNASEQFVDLFFIQSDTVSNIYVDSIRIESKARYTNQASEESQNGIPAFLSRTDSLVLRFENLKQLTYTTTEAPVAGNILNFHQYSQSRSEQDCSDNNEFIYHITNDHVRAAK